MTVTRRGQCWGCSKAMCFGSVSLITVTLVRCQVLILVQAAATPLQPCGGKKSASLGAACRSVAANKVLILNMLLLILHGQKPGQGPANIYHIRQTERVTDR